MRAVASGRYVPNALRADLLFCRQAAKQTWRIVESRVAKTDIIFKVQHRFYGIKRYGTRLAPRTDGGKVIWLGFNEAPLPRDVKWVCLLSVYS